MFKVGLTGGIGSGKTTVAGMFAELGVAIIDADVTAHALVAKGQPALLSIQHTFGDSILQTDGTLDRAKLGNIIFADGRQKKRLEAILHPLIYANLQQQIDALKVSYCIVVIPLLFETNMRHFVDRVVVVDCPVECQIGRVMARDQHRPEKIQAIIASQVSRVERCAKADDLIDNSILPQKSLAEQVKTLHNLYFRLSMRHCR
ncbi:MAG: dephospho-CoA kinase [Methylococcaceae bacterium]|nr:dephospho-CoA kinase [Methylococcaceae bacterium]